MLLQPSESIFSLHSLNILLILLNCLKYNSSHSSHVYNASLYFNTSQSACYYSHNNLQYQCMYNTLYSYLISYNTTTIILSIVYLLIQTTDRYIYFMGNLLNNLYIWGHTPMKVTLWDAILTNWENHEDWAKSFTSYVDRPEYSGKSQAKV